MSSARACDRCGATIPEDAWEMRDNGTVLCVPCTDSDPEVNCARKALHTFLRTSNWTGHDTALLDSFLDAYAHELAEQIRTTVHTEEPACCGECFALWAVWQEAADLIDPEVNE